MTITIAYSRVWTYRIDPQTGRAIVEPVACTRRPAE